MGIINSILDQPKQNNSNYNSNAALNRPSQNSSSSDARARAEEFRHLRDNAHAQNNHSLASSYTQRMNDSNNLAAKLVFAEHNSSRPLEEMDLHGLFVEEAKDKTRERIQACRNANVLELRVIVGKGIHSVNGELKLGNAVKTVVTECGLVCRNDERNAGVIIVKISPDETNILQKLFGLLLSCVKKL